MTFNIQIAESFPQQTDLRQRVREIDSARAMRRISTGQHEFACEGESTLVCSLKHERTRVGHQRGIKASRNLWGELHSRLSCQAKYHLCRGHGMGINPVHMRERPAAHMVINTDEKVIFQPLDR